MIKLIPILFLAVAAFLLLPVLLAIFSAVVFGVWKAFTYESRFRKFFSKYQNEEIARMIASAKIWTGQTAEQLRDAKGAPSQIDTIQGQEIWIYQKAALNPRGMRITLNEGRVQNWS